MSTPKRAPDSSVKKETSGAEKELSTAERLIEEGYRFEFFQAVRVLERMFPERKPVGLFSHPREEVARFRAHVSNNFPASQIQDVEGQPSGPTNHAVEIWQNFLSLAGPLGALPRHYTELISDPSRRKTIQALRDFFDIFNHRMVSLFYRAWEKYRFPIAWERGGVDPFSENLFCLIGMGTGGLLGRLGIKDDILLFYAGLLAQRPRSAVALEGILQDYFNVGISIEQFAGEWFLMNEDSLTRLGHPGRNHVLGKNAVLWARVYDPQARFRIMVGPLSYRQFREFLPVGEAYRQLVELTRFYVGEEFNFELQLILAAEEVPQCSIGKDLETRLGWSMWLKTKEFEEDTSQPILEVRVATATEVM